MLRIAICDDDKVIGSEIESLILEYQQMIRSEFEIEVFESGVELYAYLKKGNSVDLIFLDIEMEDMDGIEIGEKIRVEMNDYRTSIIYVSGKDGYDRKLFDFQPLHFLSKPIEKKKIFADLELAIKLFKKNNHIFSFKTGHDMNRIPMNKILYFESKGRKVRIVTLEQEYLFYGTIEHVLHELPQKSFLQIHRSYIINYNHVKVFSYDKVMMQDNKCLSIGQKRRQAVRDMQLERSKEMTSWI
ncbi:LytTR family DNA-binding domain-containing protein [Gottschalkiaceae bacterium SANA]|nr:LytTR family DNA-binding domain-containing protein [Gottschalkiaceae bacterium SANA]